MVSGVPLDTPEPGQFAPRPLLDHFFMQSFVFQFFRFLRISGPTASLTYRPLGRYVKCSLITPARSTGAPIGEPPTSTKEMEIAGKTPGGVNGVQKVRSHESTKTVEKLAKITSMKKNV